jgi:hypothetical protein
MNGQNSAIRDRLTRDITLPGTQLKMPILAAVGDFGLVGDPGAGGPIRKLEPADGDCADRADGDLSALFGVWISLPSLRKPGFEYL